MKITYKITKQSDLIDCSEALVLPILQQKTVEELSSAYINLQDSTIKQKLSRQEFLGKDTQIIQFEPSSQEYGYQVIILIGIGSSDASFEDKVKVLKKQIANATRIATSKRVMSMDFGYESYLSGNMFQLGINLSVGFNLANYQFLKYKSEEKKKEQHQIESFQIIYQHTILEQEIRLLHNGLNRGEVVSNGVGRARDLVNEPASAINPEKLVHEAEKIVQQSNGSIKLTVLDQNQCEEMGMGAYLSVAQGSSNKPYFIVLTYEPQNFDKTIAIIGKTVTFDTGGYSLKPPTYMEDMKIDMAGGASVLGLFSVLSLWDNDSFGRVPHKIVGILPACENMVSGNAYRPGDVVTASNSKTIEVLNTDAEGRLTLADALVYAEKEVKADIYIDIATLTGAVIVGLGEEIAGIYGRKRELVVQIISQANKLGEPVWELPLYQDYADTLKSDVADVRNISTSNYGGSITAALFLQEFIESKNWVHVDIAGASYNKGKPRGTYQKGATGWGVQTLIEFITNTKI